jgi:cytochrome b561
LLLLLHRSVGLPILALMGFRVLWRLTHPPTPLRRSG